MTSLAFLTRGAVGDSRSTRQEHHFGASSSRSPQRDRWPVTDRHQLQRQRHRRLPLVRHDFHGDWNYSLLPHDTP